MIDRSRLRAIAQRRNERKRGWGYRVVSSRNNCPDEREGARTLEIRRVYYRHDEDMDNDPVSWIDETVLSDRFQSIEEIMAAMGLIEEALHRPVLIEAEWKKSK
jgi:hypothetical protein